MNIFFQPLTQISLKDKNWWRVGGTAEYFFEPKNLDELKMAYDWYDQHLKDKNLPLHVLSGGSNILISDGLIRGLTLSLHQLRGDIRSEVISSRFIVECMAGEPKSEIARLFLKNKLAPAIFLTGLPGDMGGGVVMNAGVGDEILPKDFSQIVDWIEVLKPNRSIVRYSHKEIEWRYRETLNWQPGIILKVCVSWPNELDESLADKVRQASLKRYRTQPIDKPSGGSTFRNPPGLKAARLIEECGLKGLRIGDAQVSEKHSNFIINLGQAHSKDIHSLIQSVQRIVLEKKGVLLQTEVIYFGEWDLNSRVN